MAFSSRGEKDDGNAVPGGDWCPRKGRMCRHTTERGRHGGSDGHPRQVTTATPLPPVRSASGTLLSGVGVSPSSLRHRRRGFNRGGASDRAFAALARATGARVRALVGHRGARRWRCSHDRTSRVRAVVPHHGLPGCLGGRTAKVTPQKHSAVTAEFSSPRAAADVHRPAQAREDARPPDKADPTCCAPETSFD